MSIKKGRWLGGIRTLADLKRRCVEDGDCWIWQGCLSSNGSPSIWIHGLGHFSGGGAVCMLVTGKRPERCQNWVSTCRRFDCLNPAHRQPMTIKEMRAHSRNARTISQKIAYAAIKQAKSTLTFDDARYIRKCSETCEALAKRYCKSVSLISKIRRGELWKERSWMLLEPTKKTPARAA